MKRISNLLSKTVIRSSEKEIKVPPLHNLPCSSDCREDLLSRLSKCIDRSGMWKFSGLTVSVMTAVVLIVISAHSASQDQRDQVIRSNVEQVRVNTIVIAEIKRDLEFIKEGQREIKTTADKQFETILKELKQQRR